MHFKQQIWISHNILFDMNSLIDFILFVYRNLNLNFQNNNFRSWKFKNELF